MIPLLLTACAPPGSALQPLGGSPPADDRLFAAPPAADDRLFGVPPAAADPPPLGAVNVSARLHDAIGSIAVVDWEQSEAADVYVEFSVDQHIWLASPTRALEEGPASELILGVPYGTDVSYRVVSDDGSGPIATETAAIRTADLDPEVPLPIVTAADPTAWGSEDRYLVGSVSLLDDSLEPEEYWMYVLDRQARLVWAQKTPKTHTTLFARLSADGTRLLWDESTYWWLDAGAESVVRRTSIDLSETETIETPGMKYEYVDLPDGSIVWGDLSTVSELRIMQRRGTEEPELVWSCDRLREHLALPDYRCSSNSIWWDPRTDHLLVSLYSTSTVLEIDRATGDTLRWFGNTSGGWAFDPAESLFEWQHGASFTDEGNLTLLTRDDAAGPPGAPSIAREYALAEAKQTLVNVWSSEEGVYAREGGDVHRLSNGNTLISFGTGAKVREVTPDGTAAWSLDWEGDRRLGRTFFVSDLYALLP
jgi:hypothetical protein